MCNLFKTRFFFFFYTLVLHEYTTDSEELIHKAPSECSTTHDSIPTDIQKQQTLPPQAQQSNQALKQNFQQNPKAQPPQIHTTKPSSKNIKVRELHHVKDNKNEDEALERLRKRHSISTTHHLEQLETSRVQFNEFSCDVSSDDTNSTAAVAKQPQPIQFSFTLYDLDGHGKITKDDIASIVSTIYDSIGKTVYVPHYGKKTINVKLTVSPDVKNQELNPTNNISSNNNSKKNNEPRVCTTANKKSLTSSRRRYKARALLSDEENDEGSESDSENISPIIKLQNDITQSTPKVYENFDNEKNNIYESINNLKCCNQSSTMENLYTKNLKIGAIKNCQANNNINNNNSFDRLHIEENEEVVLNCHVKNQNIPRKRMIRKQRSQKHKVI